MPLTLHFLNVGRGDCTIIEFPSGRVGIVDIDNARGFDESTRKELLAEYRESLLPHVPGVTRAGGLPPLLQAAFTANRVTELLKKAEAGLTDPLAYYDTNIGEFRDIFRVIITHPDMDHLTGLRSLVADPRKRILNFWHSGDHACDLDVASDEHWQKGPYDKRDWLAYKALREGVEGNIGLVLYQGDKNPFWHEDGIEIWAPTRKLVKTAIERNKPNILSMVLKITYRGRSVVLGGDATADETWPAIYLDVDMGDVDVLKASHHGRRSGYYGLAVKQIKPWLTITSVGEKAHDATENYRRYSDYTVSLRKTGDIVVSIDDDGMLYYPKVIEKHWKPKKT